MKSLLTTLTSVVLFSFIITEISCQSKDVIKANTPYPLEIDHPELKNLPVEEGTLLTKEGVALGQKLFFDPILSVDSSVSCGSCHQFALGSADGKALSTNGVSGKPLLRHAPTVFNLAWYKNGLFWDGGVKNLASLAFAPLKHPDEMGADLSILVERMQQHKEYSAMFKQWLQSDSIKSRDIGRVLGQYLHSLVSLNSKYDQFLKGEIQLTALELKGKNVFDEKCAACHQPPLFTDFDYHNNGLDSTYSDDFEAMAWGRGRVTMKKDDKGKFKTPSLRNITHSAPYMHDGRFVSLDEVLDHYSQHIIKSPTLDIRLKDGLVLSEQDRKALLSFLKTLTDDDFVGREK